MKVSEFIEWLKTQDQDADIEIFGHRYNSAYRCEEVYRVEFYDPRTQSEYSDLRGNPFVSWDSPYYNKRTLFLGEDQY